MFDEGFHLGLGLLVGDAAHVAQITVDGQAGNAAELLHTLDHAVTAVGVVRTGARVVVDDAVDVEEVKLVLDVRLLVVIGAHDEQLGVGPGHAAEGVVGIQGGENPAAAVGRRQDVGLQAGEQLGMGRQPAPHGHAVPIDAEFFILDGGFPFGGLVLQLGQKLVVEIHGHLGAPTHHGWPHQRGGVEKGHGRRLGGIGLQDLFPAVRASPREADHFLELVHVETVAGNLLQRLDQAFDLLGHIVHDGLGHITHGTIGVDPDHGHVVLPGVIGEPVLDVPALIGVEDQHIRLGNGLDARVGLGQGGELVQVGTHIGRQVGANLR
ncbi:hypothetical protein DESC_720173 [Desulfosarcina cetonica]|nr:hypothetical protein DESC_720173 [Desulfosarcina cetonica]